MGVNQHRIQDHECFGRYDKWFQASQAASRSQGSLARMCPLKSLRRLSGVAFEALASWQQMHRYPHELMGMDPETLLSSPSCIQAQLRQSHRFDGAMESAEVLPARLVCV